MSLSSTFQNAVSGLKNLFNTISGRPSANAPRLGFNKAAAPALVGGGVGALVGLGIGSAILGPIGAIVGGGVGAFLGAAGGNRVQGAIVRKKQSDNTLN